MGQVGLAGLTLAHDDQPSTPWPPVGRDAVMPHFQVTANHPPTHIAPLKTGYEYGVGRPTDGTAKVRDQIAKITTGAEVARGGLQGAGLRWVNLWWASP